VEEEKGEEKPTQGNQNIWKVGFFALLGTVVVVLVVFFLQKGGFKPQPTPTISPEVTLAATPLETVITVQTPIVRPKATIAPTPTQAPTQTPTPTPEPKADLYIKEYSFNHPPKKNEEFTVTIVIGNQGNKDAGPFWWEWKSTWATTSCRERVTDGIAAGATKTVSCNFTYTSWSTYETKAIVDAENEVPESDEGNNTYTQNVIPIH